MAKACLKAGCTGQQQQNGWKGVVLKNTGGIALQARGVPAGMRSRAQVPLLLRQLWSCLGTGLLLLGLGLGQQHGVDAGQHTASSDGHLAQQLGQLLVIADGQLDVAGHDAGLLVVTSSVAS